MSRLLEKLGVSLPIVQAPMAGVGTPELAAAASSAGALGSIGIGAMDVPHARDAIRAVRARTTAPFAVNVFCHRPAVADPAREAAWLARLAPAFARLGAKPPEALREIYTSFVADDAMLALLLEERPRVVSFHFGLPSPERITALREAGIVLLAAATSPAEARAVAAAGVDAVVAQGYEAGGHRGIFDPAARDDRLGTVALIRLLARELSLPVIAAGGIMDGAGIAACLKLGASAAQLGTAFVACPESAADAAFRAALVGPAAEHTIMTATLSGRPARGIPNALTALGEGVDPRLVPDYPIAYDATKSLVAAAKAAGDVHHAVHLAGQGAPLTRALPAATLVTELRAELERALAAGVGSR